MVLYVPDRTIVDSKKGRKMTKSLYGVAVDYSGLKGMYQILDNPVSSIEIPLWLKSWRFENEHEALMLLHMFCIMPHPVSQSDFQFTVKAVFRITNIESEWAK